MKEIHKTMIVDAVLALVFLFFPAIRGYELWTIYELIIWFLLFAYIIYERRRKIPSKNSV